MIRLFDTITGSFLHEFRRGLDIVTITNIVFSQFDDKLMVCSNKDTIYLFNLVNVDKNRHSNLIYISNYLPQYFSSEWSELSFNIPKCYKSTFGTENNIFVITTDEFFYKYDMFGKCIEKIETIYNV